jgi:hypothetical protein
MVTDEAKGIGSVFSLIFNDLDNRYFSQKILSVE